MVSLRKKKDTDLHATSETDTKLKSGMLSDLKSQETHLVTGGGGYPGFWLGKRLASRGHKVILLDVREPTWTMKPGMEFLKVGILVDSSCFLVL